MGLTQLVFALYFALVSAYLSVVLSRTLRQNGRVLNKVDEGFRKMDEMAEERHKEVIELLKKGFGISK